MKLCLLLTFLALAVAAGLGKEVCPRFCTCDIFEGYKRADCSDQSLSSPCTNVAKSVEILNLSGNEIAMVDDDCFTDLKELVKLSLARNSIHTIELFAFEALDKLSYLDLSDNRLEVIDNRILERNEKLTFLDFSKNKFMLIEDSPLIISSSLELLSLRNSHLSHVYDSFFSQMPNLVDLDISNNLLITLMTSAFEPLSNLQFINLEYNRFSCDFRIEETLKMLKQRKVHVKIDKCVKNSKKPMFEKMILHPDVTTVTPDREDIEIDLVWGSNKHQTDSEFEIANANETYRQTSFRDYYSRIKEDDDVEDEFSCDDDEMFPSTCECHRNFIKFYENIEVSSQYQKKSMELRITIIFALGLILGILSGCLMYFLISLIRKKCEIINRKQVERQKDRDRMILNHVRMAQASHQSSPIPVVRDRFIVPNQPPGMTTPARSPIPAPRNLHNRETVALISRTETPVEPTDLRIESPSARTESPSVRRRTEPPRARNLSQIQTTRVEQSPTAQLINKLFRNRDPRLLPSPSEVAPLRSHSTQLPTRLPELRIEEEVEYTEIPAAPSSSTLNNLTFGHDDDGSSEYLSIDNLSLNFNLDNLRTESSTPPPPYRSIFDEFK